MTPKRLKGLNDVAFMYSNKKCFWYQI